MKRYMKKYMKRYTKRHMKRQMRRDTNRNEEKSRLKIFWLRTDGATDTASVRDARTRLKIRYKDKWGKNFQFTSFELLIVSFCAFFPLILLSCCLNLYFHVLFHR